MYMIGNSLMNQIFSAPFMSLFEVADKSQNSNSQLTDIISTETGKQYQIELPGFSKENINLCVKNGYMIVTASVDSNKDEKDVTTDTGVGNKNEVKYIHRERRHRSCCRRFYIGDGIDESNIKASFKNGILSVDVPNVKPEQNSGITIKIE